jgi:hypothetical protein
VTPVIEPSEFPARIFAIFTSCGLAGDGGGIIAPTSAQNPDLIPANPLALTEWFCRPI